jgi:heme exporter protein A
MISRIRIEDVAVRRGDRLLFEHLSFTMEAGQAVALTGRNGAGKTSLLRAAAGLLTPAAGAIAFDGVEADAAAGSLHLLGHLDGLKGGRTAWEELRFAALWCGGTEASAREAASTLELDRLLALEVRKLSAGQRRRLALARLLAAPRPVWLLDEPLAPLDSVWRARAGEMMSAHVAGGGLILAAVHDPLPLPARGLEIGA